MIKIPKTRKIAAAPLARVTAKVYGQPASGAETVEHILRELGCAVQGNIGGWRHGSACLCADRVVIVETNPYAWAAGMKHHVPGPGEPVWGIAGWVARQNAYRAFVAQHPDRAMLVTQAELVDDWDGLVEHLARFVGHGQEEVREGCQPPPAFAESADAYRDHLYMDELTGNEVRAIRAELVGEVAELYGGQPPAPIRAKPAAAPVAKPRLAAPTAGETPARLFGEPDTKEQAQ
jgi:hypothetical protein